MVARFQVWLKAKDSGRIVGPKAAKLGELKHLYPDKVANGYY